MIRLKWSNNSMMLLSVLMAILLWVYVTNVQNPVKEQEFRVAVDTRGEIPQGLSVTGLPQSVVVRVRGNNAQLNGVRSTDFQAVVDLSNLSEGSTHRPVQVTAPSGLQVVQVSPARVDLTVDRIIQRQVPLRVSVKGEPTDGFSALEPVVQPTAVLIRGPAKTINQIKVIDITANISGTSQNVEQTLMVPVPSGVSASPDRVKVFVPVTRSLPSKVLPVVVRYAGNPADQYQVVRAIAQPAAVQVFAPSEVLKKLAGIDTEPINVDGISDNLIKEARLQLPAGVVDIVPDKVEVVIQVKAKQPTTPAEQPTTKPADAAPTPAEPSQP